MLPYQSQLKSSAGKAEKNLTPESYLEIFTSAVEGIGSKAQYTELFKLCPYSVKGCPDPTTGSLVTAKADGPVKHHLKVQARN